MPRKLLLPGALAILTLIALEIPRQTVAGIIQAIIPAAVPTGNKQGNGSKFQIAGTNSGTLGNLLCNDAGGNTTDSACGGAASAVPFSGVTSGTNTNALVEGAAGTITSASTGVIESNKVRNYAVSTLPAATAGMFAYVTDGASSTDCTVGSGSTKVLCLANGSVWAAAANPGSTVTLAAPYLTVSGVTACGPLLITCTIPTACNSGWTHSAGGGGTDSCTTNTHGDLFFSIGATGADDISHYDRSVGGTFTLIAMFDADYQTASAAGQTAAGISVGDGTRTIFFYLSNLDGQASAPARLQNQKWNSNTSVSTVYQQFTGNAGAIPKMGQFIWLKLVLDSTNLTWSYSINGINFKQFDQQVKGDFLGAITVAGVGAYNHTGADIHLISLSGI